jgi:signal peptidase I
MSSAGKGPSRVGLIAGVATVALFAVLVVLRVAVVHVWRVPASSMYPTVNLGDAFAGLRWSSRSPATRRGDVIVFRHPVEPEKDFVKRVIGLPGDTVEVDASGAVRLNGVALARCLLGTWPVDSKNDVGNHATGYVETLEGHRYVVLLDESRSPQKEGTFTVPANQLFVMGDNRDNSSDSRYWGFVPFENVRARASVLLVGNEDPGVWSKSRRGHDLQDGPIVPAQLDEKLASCAPGLKQAME